MVEVRNPRMLRMFPWIFMTASLCAHASGKVIRVDDDGPADHRTIQVAIDAAATGDTVLVAAGLYTGDGNRDIDFKGKAITVKSESGPKTCIIDCQATKNEPHRGFHFHSGEDANSVLQGFTITGGFITGSVHPQDSGGGIHCNGASPQIIGCIVSGNVASGGGGIACFGSNANITACVICNNIASSHSPTWARSSRGDDGGGILSSNGNPMVMNCVIAGNRAGAFGGGVAAWGSFALVNCTIHGNRSAAWHSAISMDGFPDDHFVMRNCVIWGNEPGGCGQMPWIGFGQGIQMSFKLSFCMIQGYGPSDCLPGLKGHWKDIDPLFANPGYWDPNGTPEDWNDDRWVEGDYHLKSQAGRWDPAGGSWVQDDVTSSYIDAGDASSAVGDEPQPNGGRINLGAYGGTAEASKTYVIPPAEYGGGNGEPNDPYLIYTPGQMNVIGLHKEDWDKHFKLMADVDLRGLQGTDFHLIGNEEMPFTGVFDGNGRQILNFMYACPDQNGVGLFGWIAESDSEVRDLTLMDPNVGSPGGCNVGSLVGSLASGTVTNCRVVSGVVSGEENIGGLAGRNGPAATQFLEEGRVYPTISGCSFDGEVSGKRSVGGLVGSNFAGTISRCQATGQVAGSDDIGGLIGADRHGSADGCHATTNVVGERNVAGLVGYGSSSTIKISCAEGQATATENVGGLVGKDEYGFILDCYAVVTVAGERNIGGLVGQCEEFQTGIQDCYAAGSVSGIEGVGGLVGAGAKGAVGSFWDTQASGQSTSACGIGKTTAEMQTAGTFFFWNACGDAGWTIDEGKDYPRLGWEGRPGRVMEPILLADLLAGSGTEEDPYLIYTAEELNRIAFYPCEMAGCYKLMADIDLGTCTADQFNIIPFFTGAFDGNHHTIANFTCRGASGNAVGVFGYVLGGSIQNLGLIDPNIDAGTSSTIGALAGGAWSATVTNCYVTGGGISGGSNVGGLVGMSDGTVRDCYAATKVAGGGGVGGLVGHNSGTVTGCYSSGSGLGETQVGGLAGANGGAIVNSYAVGSTAGDSSVGGLAGQNTGVILNSYASAHVIGDVNVGGLVGEDSNPRQVFGAFWDVEASGQLGSASGMGRTTSQMQIAETFTGWGEGGAWTIDEGRDYPRLAWENKPGTPITDLSLIPLAGAGSEQDPYLIYTDEDLNTIGLFPVAWDKHFRLMADIDLVAYWGTSFNVIGGFGLPFGGVFDGAGHAIRNFHYSLDQDSFLAYSNPVGLFGWVDGPNAQIRNLSLVDLYIDAPSGFFVGPLVGYVENGVIANCRANGSVMGSYAVGGLIGSCGAGASILDCHVTGFVAGGSNAGGLIGMNAGTIEGSYAETTIEGYDRAGGLTGSNDGNIVDCYATGGVNGNEYIGGLTGHSSTMSSIASCYATCAVMGATYVGSLIGENHGALTNSYATGAAAGFYYVGGLAGANSGNITGCYATGSISGWADIGGLVGCRLGGVVRASFWDIQTGGWLTSAGGMGKTTAQMQTAATFLEAGWDFVDETVNGAEDIWWILEGRDYPQLRWEPVTDD